MPTVGPSPPAQTGPSKRKATSAWHGLLKSFYHDLPNDLHRAGELRLKMRKIGR